MKIEILKNIPKVVINKVSNTKLHMSVDTSEKLQFQTVSN